MCIFFFFFSSRRRHTRYWRDWSSDVCSSDLAGFNVRADSEWDDLAEALAAIKEAPAGTYKLSGMPVGAGYHLAFAGLLQSQGRSEERRVGKECRSRWSPYH